MAKKTNFLKQLEDVAQAAHEFIKNSVQTMIVLCTDEERAKRSDILGELPIIKTTSRHGEAIEFAIVSVEKRNGNIVLHTIGYGQVVDGDEEEFDLSELSSKDVCLLADEISKLLK